MLSLSLSGAPRAPAGLRPCALVDARRHLHPAHQLVRAARRESSSSSSANKPDDDGSNDGPPAQQQEQRPRQRRRPSPDAADDPLSISRRFQRPIPRKDMQKRARVERERAVYGLPGARVEGADLVVDLAVAAAAGAAAGQQQTPREAAAAAQRASGAALNARLRARTARLRTWREAAALVAESGPDMNYLTVAAVCVRVGELLAPAGVLRPVLASGGASEEDEEDDQAAAAAGLARERLLLRPLAALALERADWFQAPHFAAVASALALAGFGGAPSSPSSSSPAEDGPRLLAARFWREFARLSRRKLRSMTLPQLSALCAALASASASAPAPAPGASYSASASAPAPASVAVVTFRPSLAWCDMVSRAAARRLVGQRLVARRLKSPGFLGAPDPRRPSVARLRGAARREAAAQAGDLGALLWSFGRWGYAPAGRAWASDALVQVRVAADAAREARMLVGAAGDRAAGDRSEAAEAEAGGSSADGGAARRATAQALGWLSSVAVREAAAASSGGGRVARRLAPRRSWLSAAARTLTLGAPGSAAPPPASSSSCIAADAPLTPAELVEAYASLALLGYAPPPLASPDDARAAIRAALVPALGAGEEATRLLLPGASLWLAGGEEEGGRRRAAVGAGADDDDEGGDEEEEADLVDGDDEGEEDGGDEWDDDEEEDEDEDEDEGWRQDGDDPATAAAAPAAAEPAASAATPPPASASTAQLLISAAFVRERPAQERAGALSPELLARLAWAEGALSLGRGGGGGGGGAAAAEQPPSADSDGWLRLSGPAAAAAAEAAWLDALATRLERTAPRLGAASAADALWGLAASASALASSCSSRPVSRALEALGRRLAEELDARPEEEQRVPAAVVGRVAAAVVCLSPSSPSFGGSNGPTPTTAERLAALLSAPLQRRLALLLQEDSRSVGAAEISDVLGLAAMAAIGAAAAPGGRANAASAPTKTPSLPDEPLMRAATLRLAEVASAAAAAADFGGGRAAGARRRVLRSGDNNNDEADGDGDGEEDGAAAAASLSRSSSSAPAPEDLAPHLVGALWACAALRYKPEPRLLHDVLAALGSGGTGGGKNKKKKNGGGGVSPFAASTAQRALRRLSGRELSDLGWALACLRHRPGAAWLAAYAEEARARAPYLGGRALADALWALAAFGARPGGGWLRGVGAAVAARLADGGLGPRDAAVSLWALEALGCEDVSEVLVAAAGEEEGGRRGGGGDDALAVARERLVAALPSASA